MDKKSIAIIGGGLTGLVAGYRLSRKKGYQVTIFEKEKELGGLMSGFKINGTSLEKAYHHIFKTDKEIINLIKELGLQSKLKWYKSSIGLYYDKKLYPFVTPIDLLKFKPLGLIDKLRLGLVGIYLQKTNNYKKFIGVTAVDWMRKYCGEKNYKVIWEPLLRGKFHQYYDKISMAWLWARIHTRAGSDECLGYMEGGFKQIIEKLAEKVEIKSSVLRQAQDTSFDKETFDLIIDTTPSENIDYLGAVTVVFASKQNLSKYYWHNINDIKSPFLAFIQHTNLVDKKNYKNEHIYYLGTYIPHDHKYFSIKDELIYKEFFDYFKKIFPNFDEKQITSKHIFKFKNAQHIVSTKYKVESYKVGENLYKANFSQIFPEDRGMNFAVKEANKIVYLISR